MVETRSQKLKIRSDSLRLVLKEPSDSISECLADVSLPQEVITEILVRLQVKSLLRFKCVSKPWLSLISDPQFITSHFLKSSADELNLQVLFDTKTGMKKCCLYSALYEATPSDYVTPIEFPQNIRYVVVGIIDGLICLNLKGTDLCVWNPALNKIKHLNVHPEPPSGSRGLKYIFSFGYDESNDDYKVVSLQNVQGYDGFIAEVCIYSLKAESWRRIDQLKGVYLPYDGVFAYGKIYWLFPSRNPNGRHVSLDMSSEKFVELQSAEYEYNARNCLVRMGVSGGRPFVLCDYYKGKTKVDLWVLDKYGVEESWCKLVSIPYKLRQFRYQVLCILSKGEIVFGNENVLMVYNWKKEEYRKIKLNGDIAGHWRMDAYVESLVWPNNAA